MDIKSVIKTFAEAWAAASLKIEQNQASIPALSSNYSHYWRTFPTLPSVTGGPPGSQGELLTVSDWLTLYNGRLDSFWQNDADGGDREAAQGKLRLAVVLGYQNGKQTIVGSWKLVVTGGLSGECKCR